MALEYTRCPISVKKIDEDTYLPFCGDTFIEIIGIFEGDPVARCPKDLYEKCEHNPQLYSEMAKKANEATYKAAREKNP